MNSKPRLCWLKSFQTFRICEQLVLTLNFVNEL